MEGEVEIFRELIPQEAVEREKRKRKYLKKEDENKKNAFVSFDLLELGSQEHHPLDKPLKCEPNIDITKKMALLAKKNEERFINLSKHRTHNCNSTSSRVRDLTVMREIDTQSLENLKTKTRNLFIEEHKDHFTIPASNPNKQMKTLKMFFRKKCQFLTIKMKKISGNVSFSLWDDDSEVIKFSSKDKLSVKSEFINFVSRMFCFCLNEVTLL